MNHAGSVRLFYGVPLGIPKEDAMTSSKDINGCDDCAYCTEANGEPTYCPECAIENFDWTAITKISEQFNQS